jgi:hypothetical protein
VTGGSALPILCRQLSETVLYFCSPAIGNAFYKITGKDTDPFATHPILRMRQGIDPGYSFVV